MRKFLRRVGVFVVSHQAVEKEIAKVVAGRLIAAGVISGTSAAVVELLLR